MLKTISTRLLNEICIKLETTKKSYSFLFIKVLIMQKINNDDTSEIKRIINPSLRKMLFIYSSLLPNTLNIAIILFSFLTVEYVKNPIKNILHRQITIINILIPNKRAWIKETKLSIIKKYSLSNLYIGLLEFEILVIKFLILLISLFEIATYIEYELIFESSKHR